MVRLPLRGCPSFWPPAVPHVLFLRLQITLPAGILQQNQVSQGFCCATLNIALTLFP